MTYIFIFFERKSNKTNGQTLNKETHVDSSRSTSRAGRAAARAPLLPSPLLITIDTYKN